jgi:mannose-6-phosphate isomerase-like protein (cupin superfamily)
MPETSSFSKPDEVRRFPKGFVELIEIGGTLVGRATLQPGWRWSMCVKPLVNTESCRSAHFQYIISGTLGVEMDDGTRFECRAGEVSYIPAGHDAWVVGQEPVIAVDFQGMVDYARHESPTAIR